MAWPTPSRSWSSWPSRSDSSSRRMARLWPRRPAFAAAPRRFQMIKGLHHNAYRCRDSEETRRFYEDFLGLPLSCTLRIQESKSGRKTDTLHTFYRLDDGSFLAFFEAPDMPFEFRTQHDYDLHIALEVQPTVLE